MKRRICQFVTLSICLVAGVGYGQESKQTEKKEIVYEISEKYLTVWLINDSKSPIQLERPVRAYVWDNGAVSLHYTVRNTSNESLRSFSTGETEWTGMQGYTRRFEGNEGILFVPHNSDTSSPFDLGATEILEFSDGVVDKNKFSLRNNRLWIVTLLGAKTSNGTIFDSSKRYQQLEAFLGRLKMPKSSTEEDFESRMMKIRGYISELGLAIN